MSDLHSSNECLTPSRHPSSTEGPPTRGRAAKRDSTENMTNNNYNLNSMVDQIQESKTKPKDGSFLEQQPDFKATQTRRGSLMQSLWESITGSSDKK